MNELFEEMDKIIDEFNYEVERLKMQSKEYTENVQQFIKKWGK